MFVAEKKRNKIRFVSIVKLCQFGDLHLCIKFHVGPYCTCCHLILHLIHKLLLLELVSVVSNTRRNKFRTCICEEILQICCFIFAWGCMMLVANPFDERLLKNISFMLKRWTNACQNGQECHHTIILFGKLITSLHFTDQTCFYATLEYDANTTQDFCCVLVTTEHQI